MKLKFVNKLCREIRHLFADFLEKTFSSLWLKLITHSIYTNWSVDTFLAWAAFICTLVPVALCTVAVCQDDKMVDKMVCCCEGGGGGRSNFFYSTWQWPVDVSLSECLHQVSLSLSLSLSVCVCVAEYTRCQTAYAIWKAFFFLKRPAGIFLTHTRGRHFWQDCIGCLRTDCTVHTHDPT